MSSAAGAAPAQAHRYENLGDDDDDDDDDDDAPCPGTVDECIETGDGEDFIDIVDDFDEMNDVGEEGDLSYVSGTDSMGGENEDEDLFDMTIGTLEEIIMDDEFQNMQEYCTHFEDTDENKLIYMEIFAKYTVLVEGYLEQRLQESVQRFSMTVFMEQLIAREEEMRASDVFDVLVSCADFDTFKEIMLAHKGQREGSGIQLTVGVRALEIHLDEETEGEERPDLNLTIMPASPNRSLAT